MRAIITTIKTIFIGCVILFNVIPVDLVIKVLGLKSTLGEEEFIY